MSGVQERMEKMALLCRLEGWSREQFEQELRERYPHGPTPTGPPWDTLGEKLDNLYAEIMETD